MYLEGVELMKTRFSLYKIKDSVLKGECSEKVLMTWLVGLFSPITIVAQ